MSIATFESPQVASQQFFPWLFEEDEACEYSAAETIEEFEIAPKIASQPPAQAAWVPSLGGETRIGKTVLLGTVMIKLLKSYGISDAEIAEGMAAYAAQAGLAQAG